MRAAKREKFVFQMMMVASTEVFIEITFASHTKVSEFESKQYETIVVAVANSKWLMSRCCKVYKERDATIDQQPTPSRAKYHPHYFKINDNELSA